MTQGPSRKRPAEDESTNPNKVSRCEATTNSVVLAAPQGPASSLEAYDMVLPAVTFQFKRAAAVTPQVYPFTEKSAILATCTQLESACNVLSNSQLLTHLSFIDILTILAQHKPLLNPVFNFAEELLLRIPVTLMPYLGKHHLEFAHHIFNLPQLDAYAKLTGQSMPENLDQLADHIPHITGAVTKLGIPNLITLGMHSESLANWIISQAPDITLIPITTLVKLCINHPPLFNHFFATKEALSKLEVDDLVILGAKYQELADRLFNCELIYQLNGAQLGTLCRYSVVNLDRLRNNPILQTKLQSNDVADLAHHHQSIASELLEAGVMFDGPTIAYMFQNHRFCVEQVIRLPAYTKYMNGYNLTVLCENFPHVALEILNTPALQDKLDSQDLFIMASHHLAVMEFVANTPLALEKLNQGCMTPILLSLVNFIRRISEFTAQITMQQKIKPRMR